MNTPADGFRSAESVKTVSQLIDKNQAFASDNLIFEPEIKKRPK